MAQYINREKLLKRMEGYCEANCGCKPYEDALCPSCGLGDAIYMVEENHFGQVIHNAFTMMPINAKLQIANSNGVPYLGSRISKHTGV